MIQRGFTVVEIIITITIMGILLLLAVVNLNSAQMSARDSERVADIETIKSNLESYYTGVTANVDDVPRITNVANNPSVETNTNFLCGVNATIARTSAWAADGTYSVSVTPTGANDSFVCLEGDTGAMRVGMQAGKTYTLSAVLRIPVALTGNLYAGRAACISGWWYAAGTYNKLLSCAPSTTAGIYPLSVTFTIPIGATQAFIRLYNGTDVGGGIVYYDSLMITEGSTRYNFADGRTADWSWTGTTNLSTSSGPALKRDTVGTYPSIAVTSSSINMYLPDADLKVFTAPGQTDPAATFVPATNANQNPTFVTPQPTIDQFVYQPINTAGGLCYDYDCRKYNLYYRLEKDNTVYKATSKVQ